MSGRSISIGGLTLSFDDGELQLTEADKEFYAPIGFVLSKIASLEVRMDDFAFEVVKAAPSLARRLSRDFPQRWSEKTDFIIACFLMVPPLRQLEDSEGRLELMSMQYMFDEVSDFRNALVHGAFYYLEDSFGSLRYSCERHVREASIKEGGSRKAFQLARFDISFRGLQQITSQVTYLKTFLNGAVAVMQGVDVGEEHWQMVKNRALFREFLDQDAPLQALFRR